MVKGCEMRVVRLQSPESRVFEEVLFILREGDASGRMTERDIVAEANRILEENATRREGECRRRARGALPFLLGAVSAAAILLPFVLL